MQGLTSAKKSVRAFGEAEVMASHYAPDSRWSLPASLPFPRPVVGREAVIAFNCSVGSERYFPDRQVTILDEPGDEASSAMRFVYRVGFRPTGRV
jgi:hypothetical protein